MSFSKFITPIPGFDLWGFMFAKRKSDINSHGGDDDHGHKNHKKNRNRRQRTNYKSSIWYKDYIIDEHEVYR
jgi:hypothetical protein